MYTLLFDFAVVSPEGLFVNYDKLAVFTGLDVYAFFDFVVVEGLLFHNSTHNTDKVSVFAGLDVYTFFDFVVVSPIGTCPFSSMLSAFERTCHWRVLFVFRCAERVDPAK